MEIWFLKIYKWHYTANFTSKTLFYYPEKIIHITASFDYNIKVKMCKYNLQKFQTREEIIFHFDLNLFVAKLVPLYRGLPSN